MKINSHQIKTSQVGKDKIEAFDHVPNYPQFYNAYNYIWNCFLIKMQKKKKTILGLLVHILSVNNR